jgi:hypothetical protein
MIARRRCAEFVEQRDPRPGRRGPAGCASSEPIAVLLPDELLIDKLLAQRSNAGSATAAGDAVRVPRTESIATASSTSMGNAV